MPIGNPQRVLTDQQIIAAIRSLTPAQVGQLILFLLIDARMDRDAIIARLKSL